MDVMTAAESHWTAGPGLPRSRPLTVADLAEVPDDGHRYELIDGVLLVSPAPRRRHQRAVGRLFIALTTACSEAFEVLPAPFDVVLSESTLVQPDVLVARRADLTEANLPAAPVLAAEVLSPSTRLFDLNTKKARHEVAGTRHYWVVDPDRPSLTAWELQDGGYVQVAHVEGAQVFRTDRPFPVEVTPDALVR